MEHYKNKNAFKMKNVFFTIAIFTILFSSCYNDSEEALFPMNVIEAGNCDTTIFTYSKAIYPLMKGSCMSCHSTQTPVLKTHDDIASNANKILACIKRTATFPMPPSEAAKVSDCNIIKFEEWIKAGKPDN
jgi:hypothetical protein